LCISIHENEKHEQIHTDIFEQILT
jgi:hypothetical protein